MKRYDIGLWCTDGEMVQKENGEYVLHSDVIALEQENERLRRALKRTIEVIERFNKKDTIGWGWADDAREALKVKP